MGDLGSLTEEEFTEAAGTLTGHDGRALNAISRVAAMRLYRSAKLLVTQAGLGDVQPTPTLHHNEPEQLAAKASASQRAQTQQSAP